MKNKILISLVVVLLLSFFLQSAFKDNANIASDHGYAAIIVNASGDEEKISLIDINENKFDSGEKTSTKIVSSGEDFIKPHSTTSSDIQNFNMKYQIKYESGETSYLSYVDMIGTDNYSDVKGITTFRGNNYRDSASYGTVNVVENKLEKIWTNTIGKIDGWGGVGWNGQPSIITWDDDVKMQMNIYDKFKQKENFTEVIYGALDSYIHFFDLETGEKTRDKIKIPSCIKGSVTIDPRGYPLLYVGQGIDTNNGKAVKMGYFIFSLIDGKELCFINGRDKFAYIGWGAFDGNPVIDAKTDTMFLPGENGVIYIVKLNTNFDKTNGTIQIDPKITRYRYTINGRAAGTENAMTIYKNYAFFINNHGYLQCLDLKTLTPVWLHFMEDDCDATLGLEEENGKIMLYASSEVDRRRQKAPAYIRKIDGTTGEKVWEYTIECNYDANVNGGFLSSPIVGKNDISDLVIFNAAKTGKTFNSGKIVALSKDTGALVWEKDLTIYSWSSPTAVYSKDGKGYVIFCDAYGKIHLIDAKTGETLYVLNTGGGNMEGSPAIYNDIIVIGTRGQKIYGIKIK